uniref:Uncharacterized protein n=1 Tax=Romanomermis culicivorax TaxID=13658 RepID=A0A915I388_ROMCU
MLILAVCHASSIGGIGTITGCPSNIIIFGYMEKTYGKETGLTYLSWCAYCIPVVVINTLVAWAVVLLFYFGPRGFRSTARNNNVSQVVRMHYEKLGPMK